MSQEQPVEIQIPVPWGYVAGCWYGNLSSRPILALHGWQDNAGSFARLAPLIAPHCALLAIDMPGHGRSSHYPIGFYYHINDYVRVVHRIVRYYKWPKVSLLGHSMGASISFYYAAMFPLMVDMIISIDLLTTRYFLPDIRLVVQSTFFEKSLVEDDKMQEQQSIYEEEPTLLDTYENLKQRLYIGSEQSIELEYCKYILDRSVKRSLLHPEKFYFSRDSRVKVLQEFYSEPSLTLAMGQRIRNINYLVIKSENSDHLNLEDIRDAIAVLRANNPNFELHNLPGETHHVHLNSPVKVAQCIVRYVRKYPRINKQQLSKI